MSTMIRRVGVLSAVVAISVSSLAQPPRPLPIPNACPSAAGGPPPCIDADGDGFCDSWERARRIPNGPLLPGADPDKPDIYVWYDWMDYGLANDSCASALDCVQLGLGHAGETCGAAGSQYEGLCTYPCTTDNECTSRSPADVHRGERCVQNACQHTHDPMVVDSGELDAVRARFAAHGINLHILRGHAVPHSDVVSFRSDAEMDLDCEGGSIAAGTAGVGKYAVSFYDLKPAEASPQAYHYAIFGHLNGCSSTAHCPGNFGLGSCRDRTLTFGSSGRAEENGDDFVVSLGALVNSSGVSPHITIAATFMHELGHNLGLRHDGHLDRTCTTDGDCPASDVCVDLRDGEGPTCRQKNGEESNYKPNYLSVMNYRYQTGIEVASTIGSRVPAQCYTDSDCGPDGGMCRPRQRGAASRLCSMSGYVCESDSDCNNGESCVAQTAPGTCVRLDFSRQTLPAGGLTPGALNEANLDDAPGLGSGTMDIFRYTDALCHVCPIAAPSTGAVNWMGTGILTNTVCNLFRVGSESFSDTGVQADVNANGECGEPMEILHGHTDWPDLSGVPFNYKFQCVEGVFDRFVGRPSDSTAARALFR